MALDPNILLRNVTPDLGSAVSTGFKIGQDIKQAPLLRQMQEQKIAQGEQALQAGAQEAGSREAAALYGVFGDEPITAENYGQMTNVMQGLNFQFDENELPATPENISRANMMKARGKQAITASGKRSAVRGFEGDFNLRDEKGNIFSQQTFIDPNTREVDARLTDITGQGLSPVGRLTPVSIRGESVTEESQRKVTEAGSKKEAEVTAQTEAESRLSDKKAETAAKIELEKGLAKTEAVRIADNIEKGATAADGLATINRALTLLDVVETGGFENLGLKAQQAFGIEGASEAELNNLLKTAVLQQLRPTFGSAFTVEEGRRLESISQSFGSNTSTNIRLLKRMKEINERAAQRGIDAAVKAKDFDRAKQIQEAVDFRFSFDQPEQPQGTSVGRFQVEIVE